MLNNTRLPTSRVSSKVDRTSRDAKKLNATAMGNFSISHFVSIHSQYSITCKTSAALATTMAMVAERTARSISSGHLLIHALRRDVK